MSAHTPGPWTAYDDGNGCWQIAPAMQEDGFVGGYRWFSEADARLTSAATELLDALKAFRADHETALGCYRHDAESIGDNAVVETLDHRCEECRLADEAIDKAEGR